jgi:electron transport complex protein RnfB
METILVAAAVVAGLGLVLGIGLSVASVLLKAKVNELEQQLIEVLPGINCGACSFPGCAEYAKALATGKVKTTLCPVGGDEGVKKICEILGVEASKATKKVAFVQCQGTPEHTGKSKDYKGIETCYASSLLCNGEGECAYGCNGYGDCVEACNYDAIHVINGVAVVDCQKCTGCTLCVSACPKNLITMVYAGNYAKNACKNTDKGVETRKVCKIGCITCAKCVKVCPTDAIVIKDNRAVVDGDKCICCGECVKVCPTGCLIQ